MFVLPALLALAAPAPAGADVSVRFVAAHLDAATGAYRPAPNAPPSARATNAGLRAMKYLGAPVADRSRAAAFVQKCYDPATGRFADVPGGPANASTTAVGVMAAVEAGVPQEAFAKAKAALVADCKTFEEARLGAAAFEAMGQTGADAPPVWRELAFAEIATAAKAQDAETPRRVGSAAALYLRLKWELPERNDCAKVLRDGQRPDGAWGQGKVESSDLDSTYRVMRALHLLKEQPSDAPALRAFVARCRSAGGGYGPAPGAPPTLAATYMAAIVLKWAGE